MLAVLNLLFVFSKRSNFFSRVSNDKRQALLTPLSFLAENWGGKEHGFGLADCCQNLPLSHFPPTATTFKFEFYSVGDKSSGKEYLKQANSVLTIQIDNVHEIDKPLSTLMEEIVEEYKVPSEYHTQIYTHLKLTKNFANFATRLQCVQARLNALSIIGEFVVK